MTSALIFMGSGCSGGVPRPKCLIQPSDPPCPVCSQSLLIPPHLNPNYRCNTSLLIDYLGTNEERNYILIDMGKTFREQVLRWFTFYKIPRIDSVLGTYHVYPSDRITNSKLAVNFSVILTHEHADAVLGLDDLHFMQQSSFTTGKGPIPIYATQECMDSVLSRFPRMLEKAHDQGQSSRKVVDWNMIEENCEKSFVASGLQFHPLPVMHGEDYVSLGFLFGQKCLVAYVSDVSRFPLTTEHFISKHGGRELEILILDSNSLHLTGPRSTHLCLSQALEIAKRICPKRALLTGMTHGFDHHKVNAHLNEWSEREGIQVQLAHDGLRVPIEL